MKTKFLAALAMVALLLSSCGNAEEPKMETTEQTTEQVKTNTKFVLKASNNRYIQANDQGLLVANQPDVALATVFEMIDLGNGKCNLKASNGKFVCAVHPKESLLYADRDVPGEWEVFEIVRTQDPVKINIKASNGKIVCADQVNGDVLVANRDQAGEWETLTMEMR